ncbi:unnamed protein product [Wuchereria bancrofti]|nr:unnamed protein product [Wuchereria bancrofti]
MDDMMLMELVPTIVNRTRKMLCLFPCAQVRKHEIVNSPSSIDVSALKGYERLLTTCGCLQLVFTTAG